MAWCFRYSRDLGVLEYPVRIVRLWEFPEEDKLVLAKTGSVLNLMPIEKHICFRTNKLPGAATKGASSSDERHSHIQEKST